MTANDSRFFPGYVWCSDEQTCRRGLAIQADSREEAAAKYASSRCRHRAIAKSCGVWTMTSPDDVPTLVNAQLPALA